MRSIRSRPSRARESSDPRKIGKTVFLLLHGIAATSGAAVNDHDFDQFRPKFSPDFTGADLLGFTGPLNYNFTSDDNAPTSDNVGNDADTLHHPGAHIKSPPKLKSLTVP